MISELPWRCGRSRTVLLTIIMVATLALGLSGAGAAPASAQTGWFACNAPVGLAYTSFSSPPDTLVFSYQYVGMSYNGYPVNLLPSALLMSQTTPLIYSSATGYIISGGDYEPYTYITNDTSTINTAGYFQILWCTY